MDSLLKLWRDIAAHSPVLVDPQGKHLIVNENDCARLGCEIERACTPPAAPSIVETLQITDNKTMTFDACREAVGRITELQRRSGGPAWMEAKGLLANDLTFIAQGLIDALAAAPTPATQSAGQEPIRQVKWHEGDGWVDVDRQTFAEYADRALQSASSTPRP